MARKGHTEEEILRVLREAESGETLVEVCRKHGISQQSFYLWKKKYAGLGLSELRELRQLREENGVTRVLDQIIAERGPPRAIRCDNGPELTSRHFLAWALDRRVDLVHIRPGKPTQNAYVESFNSKMREECLRVSRFQNLFEARRIIAAWRRDYNERRPHSSLSYMTPAEFAAQASGGKDAGFACLKNDTAVFHFPTATAAAE
jgi:transposase-like protein